MSWSVEHLDVRFGPLVALNDLSFTIEPGQMHSVIGGDGAGKSTLLKVLAGLDVGQTGSVRLPEPGRIGFVPGGGGVFGDLTVEENIGFVTGAYRLAGSQARRRAADLLERADLAPFTHRLAGSLSGGQRRKLAGVLALLAEPELLVLDEVTTGVDPVSRMELWRLVSRAAANGTAVVAATTYLDEAERADKVLLLHEGQVLGSGRPADIIAAAPGAVVELDAPTDRSLAWRVGRRWRQWLPDAPRPATGAEAPVELDLEGAAVVLELDATKASDPHPRAELGAGTGDGVERRAGGAASIIDRSTTGPALLEARSLTRRFGSFTAVDAFDLAVEPGQVVALLGANGAGKTTVIRMALGLLTPTSGAIHRFGAPVGSDQRSRVGYVPQNLGLYADLTPAENLAFRAAVYGKAGGADDDSTMDVGADRSAVVGELSLGAQRRVAFAAATAHRPSLLILDEPTSGVSPLARSRLWDLIHDHADAGVGVLVSTHYMDEAVQADRLVIMSHGRVVATGSAADIIGDRQTVVVGCDQWARAFETLDEDGRRLRLDGRTIRVLGADPDEVERQLAAAGLRAQIDVGPATLEEVLIDLDRGPAVPAP